MFNRKLYQASKPEMEFHMINITYAALHNAHELTNRKDNIFMQIRLYIDEAHTALDIFRFAVFFYSGIQKDILTDPIQSREGVYPKKKVLFVLLTFLSPLKQLVCLLAPWG